MKRGSKQIMFEAALVRSSPERNHQGTDAVPDVAPLALSQVMPLLTTLLTVNVKVLPVPAATLGVMNCACPVLVVEADTVALL